MKTVAMSDYKSPTEFQRFRRWLSVELEHLPHTIGEHPVKSTLIGLALAYVVGSTPAWLHGKYAEYVGDQTLANPKSEAVEMHALGVYHKGVVTPGHTQHKDTDEAVNIVTNKALMTAWAAGQGDGGCKTITLHVDPEKSNWLRYAFKDAITTSTFNSPALAKSGDFICVPAVK